MRFEILLARVETVTVTACKPWRSVDALELSRDPHRHDDSPELINRCLNCPLPVCVNCLAGCKQAERGRPKKKRCRRRCLRMCERWTGCDFDCFRCKYPDCVCPDEYEASEDIDRSEKLDRSITEARAAPCGGSADDDKTAKNKQYYVKNRAEILRRRRERYRRDPEKYRANSKKYRLKKQKQEDGKC